MSQNWVWFHKSLFPTRWCPQDSVQLVQITPITMFYRWYIYGIHGVYKPIYNVWGHHLVWIQIFSLWVASKYLLLVTDFPCLITASETVVPPACLLVLSVVKPSNIWGWNVWLMILVVWVVINAVFFCLCGAFLWPIGDGMYMWGMWGMDWQLVEWNQTQAITLKSWICDFQVTLWWFKIAMESYGKGSIYGRITCEIVMFHNHVRWPDVCDMWVMCIPFHSVWIKHRAHQKKTKLACFQSQAWTVSIHHDLLDSMHFFAQRPIQVLYHELMYLNTYVILCV